MCEPPPPVDLRWTRRRFLAAAPVGLAIGPALASTSHAAAAGATPDILIVPRSEWGPGLRPTGPVPDEPDVRFLLVHHSVNANTYAQSSVPAMLSGIFGFHTGDKGWPDIAYNFFVDRFGGVWEGRLGSLERAKAVDATGGSQGFAQLCCFLGDHTTARPSEAAVQSMGILLGQLAARYGVDLADSARARFTSRGSNRYPAGSAVDVATISGHRDVSQTACPGDAAYALVTDGTLRRLARGGAGSAPTTTTTAATTTTTTAATTTTTSTAPTTTRATPTSTSDDEIALGSRADDDGGSSPWPAAAAGAGALAVATAGALALRARRGR